MRNPNPIDDDDDDIREGSIHGLDIPMNESLFADIGTDDMSGFADSDKDSGEFAINYNERHGGADSEPGEVFDIDATEPPTFSTGSGLGAEDESNEESPGETGKSSVEYTPSHNEYESSDEAAQLEYAAAMEAEKTAEVAAEIVADKTSEFAAAADATPASGFDADARAHDFSAHEAPTYESAAYEAADEDVPPAFSSSDEPIEIAEDAGPAYAHVDSDLNDVHSSYEAADEEPSPSPPADVATNFYAGSAEPDQDIPSDPYAGSAAPGQDLPSDLYAGSTEQGQDIPSDLYAGSAEQGQDIPSDLHAGSSQSSDDIPSDLYAGSSYETPVAQTEYQETAPEFEPEPEPVVRPIPSKPTGLLSKFTGKRDTTAKPATEAANVKSNESTGTSSGSGSGFEKSALDSIGAKPSFDKSSLDSIGANQGFDKSSLDSIGANQSFDKSSLDSIGANQSFDKSSLDSIGTGKSALGSIGTTGSARPFDSTSLDAIGTGGAPKFDAGALDSIGATPAAETPPEKEKPKGLLGGKFGQKSKSLLDKPRLGGSILPPSTDANFDQKETGRFMVDKSEVLAAADSQSLTAPAPSYEIPSSLEVPSSFEAPSSFEVEQPALDSIEPQTTTAYEDTAEVSADGVSGSFFDASTDVLSQETMPELPGDEIGRLLTDADNAYRLRQFKAAEPIFTNALEKLDKNGNDADPLLSFCLDRMGDNFYQMKRHKEALPVYRRLLTLQTKISAEDRDMISTLYKIAQTSEALNLTSEADSMYKRAFRLGQQSLVPGDPLLAKVLEGYGTMLMRSEGAEPPGAAAGESQETATAEKVAEAKSGLSADEIAALNALKVKADAEPSPIILSAGPTTPAPDASLGRSGSRTPLRESDERADKVRASNAGPSGTAAGGLGVRLGIFVTLIAGLLFFVFNIKSDFSAKHVEHSKDFQKKTYKSPDNAATYTIVSEDQASKDAFGKHINYEYINFDGGPADDMAILSGQINPNNFIYLVPQGLKTADGTVFYEGNAPEHSVISKMKELGAKAQSYYKAKGQYPDGKELDKLVGSLNYKNPFGDAGATASSIAWPPGVDPSQVFSKSKLDAALESGGGWEGEPAAKPGQISAVSSSQKGDEGGQGASVFYIHARDRDGALISKADGKTLLLSFKNGIDVTPGTADTTGSAEPGAAPVLRLSKSGAPVSAMTVLLSYIPVIFFVIMTLVFLAMANKGADPTKGFNLATIGMIWSPIMVVLTMLMKLAPPQYSTIATIAAVIGFVAGIGYIAFKFISTQPKKPKKPKIEASSM